MNIDLLKSRFSPEMLGIIKSEVDTFVQEKFTLDDYTINKNLIDTFFTQPVFYSTLLNYYTMYEQRSTLSLSDIYLDDHISTSKKDAYFDSFASDIGIDTSSMTSEGIVSAIENRLTVSDTRIHSDMMVVVKEYDKAIDGSTGIFWTMFRNSPDLMYFSNSKFSVAIMYEKLKSTVEISEIMNQSINMSDVEKYKNISNSGRVTNFIDIYVDTNTTKDSHAISISDGETKTIVLPDKKWKSIKIDENARGNIKCINIDGGYLGFASKSITLEATGPISTTILTESYIDDPKKEHDIKSKYTSYDIEFFGLIPIYIDIKIQNKNAMSKVAAFMSEPMVGSKWSAKINELSRLLVKSGNAIVNISAEIWINPLVSKNITIYNNNLTISPKSIFSWIDIDNTCIQCNTVIDSETGDVTSL